MAKDKKNKNKPKKQRESLTEKIKRKRQENIKRMEYEAEIEEARQKDKEIKEQKAFLNQNQIVEWNYGGKADLTIGEIKLSNKAKIALIILLVILISGSILAFLNKEIVYDFVAKPEVILTEDKVEVELGSKFNCKDYVLAKKYPKRYKITYPDNKKVNTKKVGTYKINYKLKTLTGTNISTLVVKVVDKENPVITLTTSEVTIKKEETSNFNPASYIKSVTDNCTPAKKLKVDYPKKIDWSSSAVNIDYVVKDEAGNIGKATLKVNVGAPPAASNSNSSSRGARSNGSGGYYRSHGSGSNGNSSNSSGGGGGAPYISGVHNVSVPVGSSLSEVSSRLISGVSGSGYVSCDFSGVNTTAPGSYTVTFSSSDGVTKYATVTVY